MVKLFARYGSRDHRRALQATAYPYLRVLRLLRKVREPDGRRVRFREAGCNFGRIVGSIGFRCVYP